MDRQPGFPADACIFAMITCSPFTWRLVVPYPGNPSGLVLLQTGKDNADLSGEPYRRRLDAQMARIRALFISVCVPAGGGPHDDADAGARVVWAARTVDVKIDVDLTLLLGSPERYYEVATESPERQQEDVEATRRRGSSTTCSSLSDSSACNSVFRRFSAAKAQKADYLDASMSKLSTFSFVAALPAGTGAAEARRAAGRRGRLPSRLHRADPSAHLSVTRWLEEGMHESDPFVWAGKVPRPGRWGLRRAASRARTASSAARC